MVEASDNECQDEYDSQDDAHYEDEGDTSVEYEEDDEDEQSSREAKHQGLASYPVGNPEC